MTSLERPFRLARRVTEFSSLGVVVSGVLLFFFYRPSGVQASGGSLAGSALSRTLSIAHIAAIALAIQGIVALTIIGAIRQRRPGHGLAGLTIPGVTLAVAISSWAVATVSGILLRWDQLALPTVTVGNEFRGYTWLFGDEVQFVLSNGAVVEVSSFQRTTIIHLVAAGLTLLAGLVPLLRTNTDR